MSVISSILGAATLISSLSQNATNGGSPLGTLSAPSLGPFLTNNPLPNGYPWGTATAAGTNPYTQAPVTGVIRSYDFTISRDILAPDGVTKNVLVVNGQFPGPIIEANWGDTIQVTVHNKIVGPVEGTSLHWHGLLQKGSQWEDGTPAVTQCPIAPGQSFTYSFNADLYGTSWYHSHYTSQYSGGALGPMIIHGPKNAPYDIDLGPVMISDWYHTDYDTLTEELLSPLAPEFAPAFPSDNNLINGKMDYDCANAPAGVYCTPNAGLSKFKFTTGKTHRLRLINTGSEGLQRFTIDDHTMTIIANDFVPIVPYQTNVVTLAVGQRTDVLVTATGQANGSYWMRADIQGNCAAADQIHALAVIHYPNAQKNAVPTTTATVYDNSSCFNDPLSDTVPFYSMALPASPGVVQEIDITLGKNASNVTLWYMNNSTFRANYNDPVLLLANKGNDSYPYDPEWNIYNFESNSSVRIIVRNHIPVTPHPMHLHGHDFWVLSEGPGDWDGTITNPQNPQRRDTQLIRPANGAPPDLAAAIPSHLVIEYNQDNPGIWPFHCHIAWHASTGFFVQFMERPADIAQLKIPTVVHDTCTQWTAFTNNNKPNQIDSGE